MLLTPTSQLDSTGLLEAESPPVESYRSAITVSRDGRSIEGYAMAKREIEVVPFNGSSYFVDVADARAIVRLGNGKWDGPSRVRRTEDNSKRGEWSKIQSGVCGPLVMQLR